MREAYLWRMAKMSWRTCVIIKQMQYHPTTLWLPPGAMSHDTTLTAAGYCVSWHHTDCRWVLCHITPHWLPLGAVSHDTTLWLLLSAVSYDTTLWLCWDCLCWHKACSNEVCIGHTFEWCQSTCLLVVIGNSDALAQCVWAGFWNKRSSLLNEGPNPGSLVTKSPTDRWLEVTRVQSLMKPPPPPPLTFPSSCEDQYMPTSATCISWGLYCPLKGYLSPHLDYDVPLSFSDDSVPLCPMRNLWLWLCRRLALQPIPPHLTVKQEGDDYSVTKPLEEPTTPPVDILLILSLPSSPSSVPTEETSS